MDKSKSVPNNKQTFPVTSNTDKKQTQGFGYAVSTQKSNEPKLCTNSVELRQMIIKNRENKNLFQLINRNMSSMTSPLDKITSISDIWDVINTIDHATEDIDNKHTIMNEYWLYLCDKILPIMTTAIEESECDFLIERLRSMLNGHKPCILKVKDALLDWIKASKSIKNAN